MRLNNELIVLDLEATSNQEDAAEKPAVQTNNFIIEIGATFLDRDLKLVDTFQRHFPEREYLLQNHGNQL